MPASPWQCGMERPSSTQGCRPFPPCASTDKLPELPIQVRQQPSRGHAECLGETVQVVQRDVQLAALDRADMVAMQLGTLSQLFLRPAPLGPKLPNPLSKGAAERKYVDIVFVSAGRHRRTMAGSFLLRLHI